MWQILFSRTAQKDKDNLSPDIKKRIINKLEYYRQAPNPLLFAKRLHDDPEGTHKLLPGNRDLLSYS